MRFLKGEDSYQTAGSHARQLPSTGPKFHSSAATGSPFGDDAVEEAEKRDILLCVDKLTAGAGDKSKELEVSAHVARLKGAGLDAIFQACGGPTTAKVRRRLYYLSPDGARCISRGVRRNILTRRKAPANWHACVSSLAADYSAVPLFFVCHLMEFPPTDRR